MVTKTVPMPTSARKGAPGTVREGSVPPSKERAATAALWLIVLATIVLLPDAFVRWFLPKDAVAAMAVAVASVGAARGRLPRWFVVVATAAGSVALVSVLLSAAPTVQLWGRWPRYEGLVTLPVYFGAVWVGARLLGPTAPSTKPRTLIRAAATAAIALGLVSLLEAVGAGPFPSDLARPGSLAGNASDQGILGSLLLSVLLLPVLRAWAGLAVARAAAGGGRATFPTSLVERLWLTAALVLAATSVVLSASRAGLLSAGVVVCVLLVLEIVRLGRGFALRTVGGGVATLLVLLGGALAVPFTRDRLVGSSPLSGSSMQSRFTFWQDSLTVLSRHPLGVGPSGFLNANAAASTGGETLDSPHNLVLQVAMSGGIPLVILVVGIAIAACVRGLRSWGQATRSGDAARGDLIAGALAGLAGFGIALQTHFTAPSTTILAALLLGAVVSRAADSGIRERVGVGVGGLRVTATIIRTVALFG